ncbi:MAG: IS110 family transposase [Stellaceae bacterium]
MKNYAGLDVSLEETAIAVVDETGRTAREAKVASEIEAIDAWLRKTGIAIVRLGLEAGPLSSWLYAGLKERGWPAICIETRRLRAVTRAMPVKNDRKDAEAIAQVMRTGWYRAVHVKSPASQRLRVLLRHRKILQAKRQDLENELRGTLKAFGLKLGMVGRAKFAERVGELVAQEPWLERLARPMLAARAALLESFNELHALVLKIVKADAVCQRFMTIPGIGAVNALAYKTGLDDPTRFRHSADVGPHFGLTPRRYESGQTQVVGPISKCGDAMVRSLLFEAAMALLCRVKAASSLKRWARALAKKVGTRKAAVALARRLAVIMHRMWLDRTDFNPNLVRAAAR